MTPMGHPAPARRISPCPGCATCRRDERRERLIAALVLLVFVGWFALPMLAGWR